VAQYPEELVTYGGNGQVHTSDASMDFTSSMHKELIQLLTVRVIQKAVRKEKEIPLYFAT
jgi:urocanate hydratase